MLEFAAAALKSIVANGALAWSKAQDTIEDEDTTEDAIVTPRTQLRTAPTKRGGHAEQGPSSEASKTAVGHKPAKGLTRNSERNLERAGHSRIKATIIELVFSLLFDDFGVPFALLPPPPARGYSVRLPGEEVDERVC